MHRRTTPTGRTLPATAAAVIALLAGGCTYTADVRNTTAEPVLVRMVQKQALKREWMMDSIRVPPGERLRLGPGRSTAGKVFIEAGERTRSEEPVAARIGAGRSELEIVLADDGRSLVLRKPGNDAPTEGNQAAADPSVETQK